MAYALLSVSDKTGIVEFGRALVERGWDLLSTGGTGQALLDAGVPVTGIAQYTGFPEILGGRVKTLHPKVHGGILARPTLEGDAQDLARHGVPVISLVGVNLYPFRETVAKSSTTLAEALEKIDIGGPTMLRAAAKNHPFVWSVCDPADYERVLVALDSGEDPGDLRRALAAKVYDYTATYDAAVAAYLEGGTAGDQSGAELPKAAMLSLSRVQSLRYGENPDQRAAFYRDASKAAVGIPALRQLHGKDLSYNNILDVDGAMLAIAPFIGGPRPACAILKHTTPCGVAVGRSTVHAYEKALACDPVSAFGSTVVFNEPVTEALAEALSELFVECLVAPAYAGDALRLLQRKKNIRILEPGPDDRFGAWAGHLDPGLDVRGVVGGLLVQSSPGPARPQDLRPASTTRVVTRREPTTEEWDEISFAWAVTQSVKSNAIVLTRDGGTIGIGAGQMSRVDAVKLATRKAGDAGLALAGATLASDAFFPFRDGVDAAADAGVRVIVQPGGSKRDDEAVQAADQHDMAMVFTGRRLFRH